MFASQYVFVTLLAVVLVSSSVTDDIVIAAVCGGDVETGDRRRATCTVDGKQYPLNAKWPSTKPGECAQYTCIGHDQVAGVGCGSYGVLPEPGQVCYDIQLEDAPYPYCCLKYHCVKKSEDSDY